MPITLALADDHIGLRESLAQSLETHGIFKVIIHANNGRDLLTQLERATLLPDICVIELKMEYLDGIETLKLIRHQYPNQKVFIYSTYLEDYNFRRVYKFGANGAISKMQDLLKITEALKTTHVKGLFIPPNTKPILADAIKKHKITLPKITSREIEFLRYYCDGLSNKEIADHMCVSVKTIDSYRNQICRKLAISSRNGLLMFALKTGIAGWKI